MKETKKIVLQNGDVIEVDAQTLLKILLEFVDDQELMDKVNKMTFPFTSRYNH